MTETAAVSQITAQSVSWSFDLMEVWGPTGRRFFVFPDGDHIIASNQFTAYRLPADAFEYLSEFMTGKAIATFTSSPYGVTSDALELNAATRDGVLELMTPNPQDEECTLLPIGFSEAFGDVCTTFCASASGRVEVVQSAMLVPLASVTDVTFRFSATERLVQAMQGDLCVAAIMAIAENDNGKPDRQIAERIARAAYDIVTAEARS